MNDETPNLSNGRPAQYNEGGYAPAHRTHVHIRRGEYVLTAEQLRHLGDLYEDGER